MDTKQVNDALEKIFREEDERVIFRNDPDKEFADYLSQQLFSPVEGVQVIRLDQASALEVKLQVERKELKSRFMIYSAAEKPDYEND